MPLEMSWASVAVGDGGGGGGVIQGCQEEGSCRTEDSHSFIVFGRFPNIPFLGN